MPTRKTKAKSTQYACGCSVCPKCGRAFIHKASTSKEATKRTGMLCRLHRKKCKGELNLTPSTIHQIMDAEIESYGAANVRVSRFLRSVDLSHSVPEEKKED